MRSVVTDTIRVARFAALLLAVSLSCNKQGSTTYIDVSVFADTALSLDSETITARAAGKPDLAQAIAVASQAHLTLAPSGLADGTIVTIEAVGLRSGAPAVLDRAQVAISTGHRVSVSLYLTEACSGVLACSATETCRMGSCMPIPPPVDATDGGGQVDLPLGTGGADAGAGGGGGGPVDGAVDDLSPMGGTTGTDGGGSDTLTGCSEGTTQACSSAPFNKKGACGLDIAKCTGGKWVGCVDTKGADTCDPGNDNNCNGMPNEGCPCVNGATQDCGHASIGSCKTGKSTCANSTWGACVGNVEPAPRDCTSANDNDCDGKPDNTVDGVCKCLVGGPSQSCNAHPGKDGNGPCKAGTQTCVAATNKASSDWGACSGAVGPGTADLCDPGNDNNCNGMPNEGCPCVNGTTQDCGHAAVGTCKPGKATCVNSAWGACVGNVEPAARDCTSAKDNDCDGKPDNTIDTVCKCAMGGSQACNTHPGNDGKGPCKAGTQTCVVASNKATSDWGTCSGAVGPAAADTCNATSDENCNGSFHDGCTCVNGQPVACQCGSPTTCTNGVKGNCATLPTTLYRDSDGDGYGLAGTGSLQCPGSAGYSPNSNDCDDSNATFKPGASICANSSTSNQLLTCQANGTVSSTSCSDGCLNGSCRSDGTIGLPGYVSCTASGSPRCTTSQGCNLDDGTCGLPADMLHFLQCDGPNDCPAGQICCGLAVRGTNQAKCFAGNSCDSLGGWKVVCDPLVPLCIAPLSCGSSIGPASANVCS